MKGHVIVRWPAATIIALAAALVPAIGRFQIAAPAFANSACQSGHASVFDGFYDTQSTWGASAWIVTRDSNFCTQPPSDPLGNSDVTAAWSMVVSGDGNHYAQSGYSKYRAEGSQNYEFAQYTYSGCNNDFCDKQVNNTYYGDNIQYYSAYHVKVQGNQIEMWAGDLSIAATPYDPACTNSCPDKWPGPWTTQYFGETLNAGNDVPGSSSAKASFTSASTQPNKWTGTYPSFQLVGNYPSKYQRYTEPYYCFNNTGSSSFDIWTSGSC